MKSDFSRHRVWAQPKQRLRDALAGLCQGELEKGEVENVRQKNQKKRD